MEGKMEGGRGRKGMEGKGRGKEGNGREGKGREGGKPKRLPCDPTKLLYNKGFTTT